MCGGSPAVPGMPIGASPPCMDVQAVLELQVWTPEVVKSVLQNLDSAGRCLTQGNALQGTSADLPGTCSMGRLCGRLGGYVDIMPDGIGTPAGQQPGLGSGRSCE